MRTGRGLLYGITAALLTWGGLLRAPICPARRKTAVKRDTPMTRDQMKALLPDGTDDAVVTALLDAMHAEITPYKDAAFFEMHFWRLFFAIGDQRQRIRQIENLLFQKERIEVFVLQALERQPLKAQWPAVFRIRAGKRFSA